MGLGWPWVRARLGPQRDPNVAPTGDDTWLATMRAPMGATAIDRVAVPRLAAAGMFVRRTLGEFAALAQVVLGTAVVVAASERRSLLSSAHHGAFTT